jgi:hypothetical protein
MQFAKQPAKSRGQHRRACQPGDADGNAPVHSPRELIQENHMHAVSFYSMVDNLVKIHSSIRTTPAMEAGVTDFLWSMEDIVLMSETTASTGDA